VRVFVIVVLASVLPNKYPTIASNKPIIGDICLSEMLDTQENTLYTKIVTGNLNSV